MTLSYDTVNRQFLRNGGLANGGFHKMVITEQSALTGNVVDVAGASELGGQEGNVPIHLFCLHFNE